jgi:uncharacterized pyridoxamine 5'-phosphate oxidase family protein
LINNEKELQMNREEVITYIQEVHFGYLATLGLDEQPHVRPIGIHTVYDGCLYFFTFSHTRKVAEMENNPQVEVVWSRLKEQSQVRIRGKVSQEKDEAIQQKFIADNPMVTRLLPPEAQHLFRLYRLRPEEVEAADGLVPYTAVAW